MAGNRADLLKRQIERLEAPDFDLEAWKSSTIVALERLFGRDSQKIKQIEQIRYDFGSWSLRDSSASISPLQSCKRRAREILEMAADEIADLDEASQAQNTAEGEIIIAALEEELKMAQFRELKNILISDEPVESKKKQVIDALNRLDPQAGAKILAHMLTNPALKLK